MAVNKVTFTSNTAWETEKQINSNFSDLDTNKADITDVPTKTSDLTNDGDGTDNNSPFATQAYVETNGGKIDSISVNGTPQTIDTDKNVDITVPTSDSDLTNDRYVRYDVNNQNLTITQQGYARTNIDAQKTLPTTSTAGKVLKSTSTAGTVEWADDTNTNDNQTVKAGNVTFGDNDVVDIVGGSNVTVTGDAANKTITIASSYTDTGATSVETTGSGNAVTTASYDGTTRKLTLTKGETFVKTSDVDNALNTSSTNPVQNKVIAELIPSEATSSNKLADKAFVNSSIATNTANFIGTFANVPALEAYSGTVTNNDYAFVINSVITDNGNDWASLTALNTYDKTLLTNYDYAWIINGSNFDLYRFDIVNQTWDLRVQNTTKAAVTLNTAYNRYKATVSNNTVTWDFEYTLNNSSFTASQWASINSGMTSADKTKLDNIEAGAQVNTVDSVNGETGTVVLDASDVGALPDSTKYGASLSVSGTSVSLKDQDGNTLSTITTQDTDTGATALSGNTAETGKAFTAASYDSSNRTITFTKGSFLTSHQSIKTLDTTATSAQSTSASEDIAGSGTITLHKVSKTGSYNDLLNKPTIPAVPTEISFTSSDAGWSSLDSDGFYTLTITSSKTPDNVFKTDNSKKKQVLAGLDYDGTYIYVVTDTKFSGVVTVH